MLYEVLQNSNIVLSYSIIYDRTTKILKMGLTHLCHNIMHSSKLLNALVSSVEKMMSLPSIRINSYKELIKHKNRELSGFYEIIIPPDLQERARKHLQKNKGELQLHEILKIPDWRGILFLRHIVNSLSALDSPSIYHR